ncbi:HK97 gp10 family phage protein [Hansschlegelia beijingensis]|uniref:HK97 gp10 family phage protein n=2 Tax=Hansschlegelia beijingensis TaxID=1133344 RepID=A0A7W6D5U6_9HYPH|nr:HK97 gp10 family phage protein [Hansschlegelia beijingensis]
MRKDIAKGADEIVAMQRALAPVEDGDLKRSISWTFGEAPPTRATGAPRIKRSTFVPGDNDIRATIYAGDDVAFYARWVEFGTAPHSLAKGADRTRNKLQDVGGWHPGARPRPFFFTPYRTLKKRVVSRISRGIRKAARKVARS